ncbi:MAG: flagellar biosynthesis protein FlhF [Phycisphaerae bacterium]|nr:MAG: flagellar biosynthesis protein FlhF [Phycisphaerae bacterium]
MQLQTFQGSSMAEAMARVKSALGADAVILHTRTVQHRRWLGLKRVELYEITAGKGINVRTPVNRSTPERPVPQNRSSPAVSSSSVRSNAQSLMQTPGVQNAALLGLTQEVTLLKSMVKDLVSEVRHTKTPGVPEELFDQYLKLVENLVADELALEITRTLQKQLRPELLADTKLVREKLAEQIEKLIPPAGPIQRTKLVGPHVVALIGPTGVGKTTTIAKLAANLKLREKRKVGLITIDTFRIAAIDQLKKYADILGAPLRIVATPEEMPSVIASMNDCEFILIDTAGRSPNDTMKLNELKRFLELAGPDEVHLVLSTTASESCVNLAMEKFSEVRVDKLIFTKLDEAAQLGVVLNVVRRVNKGLAYITTGQEVPNDIEVGHGKKLARMILGDWTS